MDTSALIQEIKGKIYRLKITLMTLEEINGIEGEVGPFPAPLFPPEESAIIPDTAKGARKNEPPQKPHKKLGSKRIGSKAVENPVNKRQAIIDYIGKHPNCKREEISSALAIPSTAISFHLTELKKSGKVDLVGHSATALWSLKESPPQEKGEASVEDPAKKLECEFCGKRFSYAGGLAEHKRIRHAGGK